MAQITLSGAIPVTALITVAQRELDLRKLEEAGLIRRHRRAEQGTKQRKSTRYLLGVKDDFLQNPCPDSRP